MPSGSHAADQRDFMLAAHLAAVVVRPLDCVDDHAARLEPLTASEMRSIASHPAFRGPVNGALMRSLSLRETPLGPDLVEGLRDKAHVRCAVLLVSEPIEAVNAAIWSVASAILHKRVLKLTLKADLDRVRSILGTDGFEIASRQAPLLHAGLADFEKAGDPRIFDPDTPEHESRRCVLELGHHAVLGFIERTNAALHALMLKRCPPVADGAAREKALRAITAEHCDHIVKVIRRRVPEWSPIIG